MDRLDITAIMEGEEYVEEMLDIFIEDTTEELSGMRDAFSMRNYVKLGSIIHKAAPLWEMIRINIPRSELKGMASMPPEKWGGISDERIEKLIEAVEQAVEKAKKIKEKTYGNRIGSGRRPRVCAYHHKLAGEKRYQCPLCIIGRFSEGL